MTAQKNMKIYKKPNGKKVSYTLKKGKKIKVLGAYVKSGNFYLKVKETSSKKTGWLKCLKKFPSTPPFQEVLYAG